MNGYIYLAGPYSHELAKVRQERFEALTKKAAELMRAGHVVYSPITHGHTIAMAHTLPMDFIYWKGQCFEMLRHARQLTVLRLPGYVDSVGVTAEIKLALDLHLPIEYIDE